jgi:hypothetical protein
MKRRSSAPLSRQITSRIVIWLSSSAAAVAVYSFAITLQWLIYNDWLHRNGPLRTVGSALSGILTFLALLRWQSAVRKRKLEMLRRFETVKWMNDRIRNSLQAIECVTYAADPMATDSVRRAVDAIEDVLQGVLVEAQPGLIARGAVDIAENGPSETQFRGNA